MKKTILSAIVAGVLLSMSGCGTTSTTNNNTSGNNDGLKTPIGYSDVKAMSLFKGINGEAYTGSMQGKEVKDNVGVYRFNTSNLSSQSVIKNAVVDSNNNNTPDVGEPIAPDMVAPYDYTYVSPFSTLISNGTPLAAMWSYYPHSSAYKSNFDFDFLKIANEDLDVAKEISAASVTVSFNALQISGETGDAPTNCLPGLECSEENNNTLTPEYINKQIAEIYALNTMEEVTTKLNTLLIELNGSYVKLDNSQSSSTSSTVGATSIIPETNTSNAVSGLLL